MVRLSKDRVFATLCGMMQPGSQESKQVLARETSANDCNFQEGAKTLENRQEPSL